MDWIADADRIDRDLAAKGYRDGLRMRAMAKIMTVFAQMAKEQERLERHALVLATVDKCRGNVALAAELLNLTPRAVYFHLEKEIEAA